MSGSLESVRRNACVHRLDLSLDSHPKELWGNRARSHVNSKGNIIGGSNPPRCITQDSELNTLSTELLWSPNPLPAPGDQRTPAAQV